MDVLPVVFRVRGLGRYGAAVLLESSSCSWTSLCYACRDGSLYLCVREAGRVLRVRSKEMGTGEDLACSIVIATRHRPDPLRDTLSSITHETKLPREIIIVDSSLDAATRAVCESFVSCLPIRYVPISVRSSARQRNAGAQLIRSPILVFLDDDVLLEPEFLERLLEPLVNDASGCIGGVGGTIVNELLPMYSILNRKVMEFFVGVSLRDIGGKVVGPAVQFAYGDIGSGLRDVDVVSTCACAYRKSVFDRYGFADSFEGYSFMEDVHLSCRVRRDYRLLQVGGARLRHLGLGTRRRSDWVAHGESRLLNRHFVMTDAMGKDRPLDVLRLLGFELIYSTVAGLWNGGRGGCVGSTLLQLVGGLRGVVRLLAGKSPHKYRAATGSLGPNKFSDRGSPSNST